MCELSGTVRRSMSALFPNRGAKKIIVLLTVTLALFTHSLTINQVGHPDIIAKTRLQLRPITVNAFLYDIIRISAPVITENSLYYLHKPNGDAMKLNITSPRLRPVNIEREVNPLVVKFVKHTKPIINQENNYDVFTLPPEDLFDKKLKKMEENEFLIGPLSVEDHGNWLLSVYTRDFNNDWIELFQVISVTITEYVPLTVLKETPESIVRFGLYSKPTLNLGDTLNVSIAFPIPNLDSCELVAPRSTFDRFYDRSRIDMSTCGFSVPNITVNDAGLWKILAVGKMVYEGEMNLNIIVNSTITKVVID